MEHIITNLEVEIIKDSRGKDTLRVWAYSGNTRASFSVPSGASTGSREAYELRDENGGMLKAVDSVYKIILPNIIGLSVFDQKKIDTLLCSIDSDSQKKNIGANATLGVSGAILRLGAMIKNIPLFHYLRDIYPEVTRGKRDYPLCYFNLINGGKHSNTLLAFQEYHVVPDCGSVEKNIKCASDIYTTLAQIVSERFVGTLLGDEGGFALSLSDVEEPLAVLNEAIVKAGYVDTTIYLALDVAASSFFEKGLYKYQDSHYSSEDLCNLYIALQKKYNLISIEDPFEEGALNDFALLKRCISPTFIIGDDITVTNPLILDRVYKENAIDGLIIKPNQIGTISETVQAINEAHKRDLVCIVSHRSGETMDDTIADIAAAFYCFGLKAGAPGPAERVVKYKRLEAIEQYGKN